MKQAFVLINSEPGAEATVLKALEAIPEVKEAHMVYGAYDISPRSRPRPCRSSRTPSAEAIALRQASLSARGQCVCVG